MTIKLVSMQLSSSLYFWK